MQEALKKIKDEEEKMRIEEEEKIKREEEEDRQRLEAVILSVVLQVSFANESACNFCGIFFIRFD